MKSNYVGAAEIAEMMEKARALRIEREREGKEALIRLCKVANGGSHQPHHIRRFLLGLYNSYKWPFELNRLRNLDASLQKDVLTVLALDWCGNEVHTYIKGGDDLWRSWWELEEVE